MSVAHPIIALAFSHTVNDCSLSRILRRQFGRLNIKRNSARLTDQRGSYAAFSCSPFTIHVCYYLPTFDSVLDDTYSSDIEHH